MPDPATESVAIVDEHNRVVGSAPRARMRAERLRHRATYILVFDSRGRLFVQKRTPTKDIYPGYYDAAAGGVVLAGEDWDASAAREVGEELGLLGVDLEPRFDFYYEDAGNRCFGRAYRVVHDGPFTLQVEEIESGEFVDPRAVLDGRVAPITPDTLLALRRLLEADDDASASP